MTVLQEKPLRLLVSNDTFYYVYCEEEPLDEEALDEIKELLAMFPDGFTISDDWEPQGDSGMIAVTFLTKQKRPTWPTHYLELFNGWLLLFRIQGESAYVNIWHETRGTRYDEVVPLRHVGPLPWVSINGSDYPLGGRVQKWVP